jgi:hypothetical protein
MKVTILIVVLTLNVAAYSQSEIMDSIEYVRLNNKPELGKSLCTNGYWNAIQDHGASFFRKICQLKPNQSLKEVNKQQNDNFCVLTLHFLVGTVVRDELYLYLKKESESWLLDGCDESKVHIKHFMNGSYSGHFSPLELSPDEELNDFGEKIVSFGLDKEKLLLFLEEHAEERLIEYEASDELKELLSEIEKEETRFDFVSQLTDSNLAGHTVSNTGYDERVDLGFIHFESKKELFEGYRSSTTLIISKKGGKMTILDKSYSPPYANTFFYNIGRL